MVCIRSSISCVVSVLSSYKDCPWKDPLASSEKDISIFRESHVDLVYDKVETSLRKLLVLLFLIMLGDLDGRRFLIG